MRKLVTCFIVLTYLCAVGLAYEDGVKGGHRPRYPPSGNQEIGRPSTNVTGQNGLCYKTVPYSYALSLNATGTAPHNTIPTPQGNSNGWITILDCCDGYQRNLTSGKCEPRCDQGCYGGVCTGPNMCTCEPGWQVQNGFCAPICVQECQKDAYCFSPNVCACKLGYDEVHGECKPICPDGCVHGVCVEPHVCQCAPGYVLNERKVCTPVCEGGCQNGECTAPGVCTCTRGYRHLSGDTEICVPECTGGCIGGLCVSPNVCRCPEGLHLDENLGRCQPSTPTPGNYPHCRCGPHGTCVGPNRCVCQPGYMVEPDTGACSPITSTSTPTYPWLPSDNYQNPQCRCGDHGICLGSNRCRCEPGYMESGGTCLPIESASSVPTAWPPSMSSEHHLCRCGSHGACVGTNDCYCAPGYTVDPDVGRCVLDQSPEGRAMARDANPHCPEGCGSNGVCVGPSICFCGVGYTSDLATGGCKSASPIERQCRHSCLDGVCVGPNRCACHPGFVVDPRTGRCQPTTHTALLCVYGCGPHGICVGHRNCFCDPGYSAHPQNGICIPANRTVDQDQRHGQNEQYPSGGGDGYQQIVCDYPCLNGECTGRNVCTCKRGYAYAPNDPTRSRCMPVCPGGCPNGVCTAPNFCICNPGYVKDTSVKSRQRCVPA